MTNYQIHRALIDWLKSMTNAPPILEENVKSTQPSVDIFLTTHFMPVDAEQVDYCGSEQKTGFIQVSVVGKRDKGSKAAQQMADKIAEHFKSFKGNSIAITKRKIESAISNNADVSASATSVHYMIPVSIYYYSTE